MSLKNIFYLIRRSRPHRDPGTTATTEPSIIGLFEDIVNTGASFRVRVTGGSMTPFLQGGEIVAIKKVPYPSLRRGDLIFFKNSQGSPVLHRLIRKRKSSRNTMTVQTKGDALIAFDEPVPYHRILGRVWTIERVPSGNGQRLINMESMQWRMINCLIALTAAITSPLYRNLAKCKRSLSQLFQRMPRPANSAKP